MLMLSSIFSFAQKATMSNTNISKVDKVPHENISKSNWVGGNCISNTYWTGSEATGGSEIFIKGDQYLTSGQQVQKVRFYHQNGNKTFSDGSVVNFNCTSYTIEFYQNPNLTTNGYTNVLYTPLYNGQTPIYSETFDLSNASSGVYEATLSTPYTYNGSTPFLVGVKFNNGKGICTIDSVYNSSITGGRFYRLLKASVFNDPTNITADANGFCLYDETDNDNGYYFRLGIELCTNASNPQCDMEVFLANTSNTMFPDTDTVISASSNFQFKVVGYNNGPDFANGTINYTCTADGGHDLLPANYGTDTISIQSQSGLLLTNTISLTKANMNAWGLLNFNITSNIAFASFTSGTLTDPQTNNTFIYNVQRNIPQPTMQTYTPLHNATNVPINTMIELTFDIDIVANPAVLSGITITGNQSAGTITYNIVGNKLQISHSSPLVYGEQYTINVPANGFLHSNYATIPTPAYSWTFTTIDLPNCATMLVPTNGQQNVATNAQLMWNSAANATSYDIYLGTTASPTLVTNVTTTTYSPTLNPGTTYFWKVVAKNAAGDAQNCDIWTFTTTATAQIPDCSSPVSPENGTINVAINANLSWSSVANATTYDVYFGEAGNMNLVINTITTNYSPTLSTSTTYLWKIVPKNSNGEATNCETWSFTTEDEVNLNSHINNDINIYPNPSDGIINIFSNEKASVSVYDITGKIITSFTMNANEVKTINEKPGIYIIKIKTKDTTSIKKLIVK